MLIYCNKLFVIFSISLEVWDPKYTLILLLRNWADFVLCMFRIDGEDGMKMYNLKAKISFQTFNVLAKTLKALSFASVPKFGDIFG